MKPSVKSLQAEVDRLKKKCEDLERANRNIFDSEEDQIQALRERIEKHKVGARQLSKAANSIYKWVAHVNGGEFRIPSNHMELTDKWDFKLEVEKDEYILTVWGDKE